MIAAEINVHPRWFWHWRDARGMSRSSVDGAQGYASHWLATTRNCRQFDPDSLIVQISPLVSPA